MLLKRKGNTKKSLFLLIACLCFFVNAASSQTCIPVFKKVYGGTGNDEGKDILYTSDGGSIVVGQTSSNTTGDYDAFILKLDAQGLILWSNQFGGTSDDQLIRIKQTIDGGYIAIGNSKSYGSGNNAVILVKTDAAGNLLWARNFGNPSAPYTAKEIIELSDGNYAFVANESDSTAQGNGIICKLDATGNTLWMKTFDHGNDDGFNYVMEDGADLYITGYATADLRDAVMIKLNKSDGNIQYAGKFINKAGTQDEAINIYKIQNGIALGITQFDPSSLSLSTRLTLLKIRSNGSVDYERKTNAGGGDRIDRINVISTNDSGFAYVAYDKSPLGFSFVQYVGPNGISEWKRNLYNEVNETSRVWAISKNGMGGFLYAGFMNASSTGLKNKITVFKTNNNGNVGTCTEGGPGLADTSKYIISNFTWSNISSANSLSNSVLTPVFSSTGFVASVRCNDTECINAPPVPPGCNTTFLMKYQSERSLRSWDITATNDGGHVIVGSYYEYTEIPFVTKLGPNGDVQWSKTLVEFGHTGFFTKVLTATDGNLIIFGNDHYVAGNGGNSTSVLLKINSSTGQLIWSKNFANFAGDITPTDDGGYVFCINEHWGSGTSDPYVVRLDAAGNIIWQRKIYNLARDPVFRSIIFAAPYIYLAADMYSVNPAYYPSFPPMNSVMIVKLDAATGGKVWMKHYAVTGESANMQTINKIADTLFIGIAMPSDPDKMYHGMICLDLNGNEIRSFKLTQPDLSNFPLTFFGTAGPFRPYNVMKTGDNNFIVADQTIGTTMNSFTITKYNTLGQILWARNYPTLSDHITTSIKEINGNLLISGIRYLGVGNNMQKRDLYFLKADLNGKVSDAASGQCFSEPRTAFVVPISINSLYSGLDSVQNSSFVNMQNFIPYERSINVWTEVSCSLPSVCNLVSVLGMSSTCSLADTFTYTIQRNPGCNLPVAWQTDPLYTSVVSFTDTTIKVRYLQNGQTYIIAKLMTGCGIFADTLFMNIMQHADSLNLGPDTSVCSGNTIVLRAGPGFKTYLWQNASVADTLAVSIPGLYYVDVTDSCGNTARDSVIVALGNAGSIDIGPDRQKCNTDTIQISATPGFMNYTWSPNYNISAVNSILVTVNPAVDTSYFIKAEKTPGCFAFDTVRITVFHSPPINLGRDTSFCTGESITLNAGPGFLSYLWSNGNTGMQININSTGTFYVTGTDANGCKSSDTMKVLNTFPLPLVQLDKNPELCAGTTRVLDPGNYQSYLWQDGSSGRTFIAAVTGTYYVQVTDLNGCKGSDTTLIVTLVPAPGNFLPGDTTICSSNSITLQASQSFDSYLWNTGSTSASIPVSQPGIYWLQVTNNKNCIGRDSITIQRKQCFSGIFVPNSFTPNNDARNDKLRVLAFGTLEKFEFSVYNRYGQLVFHTFNINDGWDGTFGGARQNSGNYVWICNYRFVNKLDQSENGSAILIR